MRPARVAAALVLAGTTWCVVGAVRSLLAPHCAGVPCLDVRFVSAASSVFAGALAMLALLATPRMGREAWVLVPLPLIGLIPVVHYLVLFQLVNVSCGPLEDLARDTPCSHPDWWLVPGLFHALLAVLVLSRSASPLRVGPGEPVGMLARIVLVAAGVTMLLMAALMAATAQAAPALASAPDAASVAVVGALAVAGAAAWGLLSGRPRSPLR